MLFTFGNKKKTLAMVETTRQTNKPGDRKI